MIVTTLMFEIILMIFYSYLGETLPVWAKIVCFGMLCVIHLTACISEDNLRNKVKRLEEEVKKNEK